MKDENDPIDCDLLIVDEFSMVDQWLFYSLLKACGNVKRILIIGDEDQIPSVGPGCVLKDLIASSCFQTIRLTKIFRQSEDSDVITLAHQIRMEEDIDFSMMKDVVFFECPNYRIKDHILTIVNDAFQKGYSENDIQILAPMYQGVAGIDTLNHSLQKMCNPLQPGMRELKVGYRTFRENDKVLQLKNQPDDDVYNGDIGTICEIVYAKNDYSNLNRIIVDFDGIMVEYTPETFQNITHAYCISIHKSQGSEYPIVVMPIVKDFIYMLSKRLIYTGITRAKKSLVLLGEKDVFMKAVRMNEKTSRLTTLTQRIIKAFE